MIGIDTHNENILSLQPWDFFESLLQTLGDLGLISVHFCKVHMLVASFEGLEDSRRYLSFNILESATAQRGKKSHK
jgi:hypothetical protein